MKTLFCLLSLLCLSAHAQTYDFSLSMTVGATAPMTFEGSFAYYDGTIRNLNVSDGFDHGTFTAGNVNGNHVTLTDFDGFPATSSDHFLLSFDAALGSLSPGMTNVQLNTDGNSTGHFACGSGDPLFVPIACTTRLAQIASAPEIDLTGNTGLATLLFGALCVLRGRRSIPR